MPDIDTMQRDYRKALEHSAELYDKARSDIRFVTIPGEQWDSALKERRNNRPCYEFPKLNGHVRQVVNEMRQTRPQGKVRGTEESDRGLAEIMQGLCRNIESVSNAEQAYDVAFECAVKGGFGVWRLCTDYANDDDFDQDIFIEPVRNPFAVKFDPAAMKLDRRDAQFAFVEEFMSEAVFNARYPKADMTDFFSDELTKDWREAGKVRVAEYWYKKREDRELWRLSTGASVFADDSALTEDELAAAGIQIVKRRKVESHKVYMRMTNGREFLTDELAFPSKFIPIVPVWGNIDNIDGEDYWQGMVRPNKDLQRLHNVHRTATVEAVAKAPKAPFMADPEAIKGYETFYNRANAEDFPVLYYNSKGGTLPMPQRAAQAEIPAALISLSGLDNEDMKASTGQYDASLGARSNETSGRAINARKQQGATSTFNYLDNLMYSIRYTYEILVDMIPRVYDTPRVVRVLGDDGGEKWKELYQEVIGPDGSPVVLNDISKGKYDVAITVGPSYATQRMEAVEAFSQLAGQIGGSFPAIGPLLAYQVVKNLDMPGSDEVDSALRKALVAQGLLEPKEGEAPPQPQGPPPDVMAKVEATMAKADRDKAEAEKTRAETMTVVPEAQADIQKMVAEAVRTQLETILMRQQAMQPQMVYMPDQYPPNSYVG